MASESSSVTIATDLLAAVAKWASDDVVHPTGRVVFRNGEIVATDGTRSVQVPLKLAGGVTGAPRFAVLRRDILAAIAAQDVMARDGIEPRLSYDIVATHDGDAVLADGPYGGRTITLTHIGGRVVIGLGGLDVNAFALEVGDYPPPEAFAAVAPKPTEAAPPEIVFQPRFLAAIDEVATAAWCRGSGVRCIGWGGPTSPMLFETQNGVRMLVMPMKKWTGAGAAND